jgi:hypothetical protein
MPFFLAASPLFCSGGLKAQSEEDGVEQFFDKSK